MSDTAKKIFLILAATFAVFGIIFLCASSHIQSAIARSLLGDSALQFESCIVDFRSLELAGLSYKNGSMSAYAERAVFKYDFRDLLCGKIKFREISIPDLQVKVSKINPLRPLEAISAKETAFGKFEVASINIGLSLFESSRVLRAKLSGEKLSFDKALPQSGRLAINFIYGGAKDAEIFTLDATLVPKGGNLSLKSALSAMGKRLFQLSAEVEPDWSEGIFEVSAGYNSADATNLTLPYLSELKDLKLSLYLKGSVRSGKTRAQLLFDIESSGAPLLPPKLANIGTLAFSGKLSFAKTAKIFDLTDFYIKLSGGKTPLAHIKSNSAVSLKSDSPERVKLGILTLSIPPELLGILEPSLKLSSANLMAEFDAELSSGPSLFLKTRAPANLTALSISKNGAPILSNLDLFAEAEMDFLFKPKFLSNAKLKVFCAESKASSLNLDAKLNYDSNSPDILSQGNGALDFSAKISGKLGALTSKIHSISNYDTSDLFADVETSGRIDFGSVKIDNFRALISNINGATVLKLETQKPMLWAKSAFRSSGELLRMEAKEVPFSIFKAALPDWDADKLSFSGSLSAQGDSIKLNSDFTVDSLHLKRGGKYFIRNLNIGGKLACTIAESHIDFLGDDIRWGTSGRGSAYASIRGKLDAKTKILEDISFKLHTSLPQLLSQPALKSFDNISRGTLELSGTISPKNLEVKSRVDNFAARTLRGGVDTFFLDATAKLDNFSFVSADLSARAYSGLGESLLLAKIYSKADSISANVDAKSLVFEDARIIFSALRNPAAQLSSDMAQKPNPFGGGLKVARPQEAEMRSGGSDKIAVRDSSAFWDIGRNLLMRLKVGTLYLNSAPLMSDALFNLSLTPNSLILDKFSATAAKSKIELLNDLKISFHPQKETPYELCTTNIKISGFDVSNLLGGAGKITGSFDGEAKFHGCGNNALHLVQFLRADAHFKNESGGELRLIDKNGMLSASASILGQSASIASRIANANFDGAEAFSEIIQTVSSITYSSAGFDVYRSAPDYNFKIKNADISGKDIVIKSDKAVIYFDPNREFFGQYLDAPISIFVAKGRILNTFQKLGLAEGQADANGYVRAVEFRVNGTLKNPKSNLLDVLTGRRPDIQRDINKIDFYKKR